MRGVVRDRPLGTSGTAPGMLSRGRVPLWSGPLHAGPGSTAPSDRAAGQDVANINISAIFDTTVLELFAEIILTAYSFGKRYTRI